jgi:acetyl esterase/lipase
MIRCFRVVVMGCLITLCTSLAAQQDARIDYQENVVYGTGGEVELHLDIAVPSDLDGPVPCIVVIHGGAWRGGDKRMHKKEILTFAQQGYVSATLQYRLCPENRFPAQVEDVKCAIRYLRAHADQYEIDPARIGAIGFSAGAHLSMMLGATDNEDSLEGSGGWHNQSSQVQAVVAFFGPTELGADDIPDRSVPLVRDFLGGSRDEISETYRRASPLTYVDEGDAPMLLFQGTEDPLVPYTQAIKMVTAMTEANVPGRVEFLIDAGHGWRGKQLERSIEATQDFFAQYLRTE